MSDRKVMRLDLRVGETVVVAGARITLEEKSGQRARLRIDADAVVKVEPPEKGAGAEQAKLGVLV